MGKPFVNSGSGLKQSTYQYVIVNGALKRVRYGYGIVGGKLLQEWSAADPITQPNFDHTVTADGPWAEDNYTHHYDYVDITDYKQLSVNWRIDHGGHHPGSYPPRVRVRAYLLKPNGAIVGTIYLFDQLERAGWSDSGNTTIDLSDLTGNHRIYVHMHTKNQAVFETLSTVQFQLTGITFTPE